MKETLEQYKEILYQSHVDIDAIIEELYEARCRAERLERKNLGLRYIIENKWELKDNGHCSCGGCGKYYFYKPGIEDTRPLSYTPWEAIDSAIDAALREIGDD